MGKLCSKEAQITESLVQQEKEISIPTYKSQADTIYELLENKYNFFRKIFFQDFLYSLVNFSNENATLEDDYNKSNIEYSMNQPFFDENMSSDYFQSFLENKILKHKSLYADAGNNESVTSIFKEEFIEIIKALGLKLEQDEKEKGNSGADRNSIVKKGHIIAFGILYCLGPNYIKTRALFNLFQQDNVLKSSEKFNEFLLALFIIASYGMASARNKLKKFSEIGAIDRDKLKELLNTSELKDCKNLVTITNKLMFGEDLSLSYNYQDFKMKFSNEDKDNSFGFLLSSSGIRYMLGKYNV